MYSRDVDEVLAQLTRQRCWRTHFYGGKKTPHLIAYSFTWRESRCADVVLLRGEDLAAAYRTPVEGDTTVLCPELVCWSYEGPALWTLRAVLNLYPPTHPDAPIKLYAAPASCRIENPDARPLVIRP